MKSVLEISQERRRDREWFLKKYDQLVEEYGGEFVAVANCKIAAHSRELDALISKLREEGHDPRHVLVEYVSKKGLDFLL